MEHLILKNKQTFGERAADVLARYAGSWGFIIIFLVILFSCVILNVLALVESWDPYPFILLNLFLSCIAALQAPIILMSQNRQAQKDRIKAEYDYIVNRKAEREIQKVLKKLDNIESKL